MGMSRGTHVFQNETLPVKGVFTERDRNEEGKKESDGRQGEKHSGKEIIARTKMKS